jgi:hypothetical protein
VRSRRARGSNFICMDLLIVNWARADHPGQYSLGRGGVLGHFRSRRAARPHRVQYRGPMWPLSSAAITDYGQPRIICACP